MDFVRSLTTMIVLFGLLLVAAGSAGAGPKPPPKPPPKFWGVGRCERTLHRYAYGEGGITADGHGFHYGLLVCVGSGGPSDCRWTVGHRARLYSQFKVFTRSLYQGGNVRSLTVATRDGPGLVRQGHHAGDQYVGWPADYYVSPASVRLLATDASPARFRSLVAPLVTRLTQREDARGCTAG